MGASLTYRDHTYVHIVNEHGHLQGVFIRIHGRLVPLVLENEVRWSEEIQLIVLVIF